LEKYVAVCCSVLQCIAVYCSVLQCIAVCCRAPLRGKSFDFVALSLEKPFDVLKPFDARLHKGAPLVNGSWNT